MSGIVGPAAVPIRALRSAEYPWRHGKMREKEEADADKLLLCKVRSIMNRITPSTEHALTRQFVDLEVDLSPALSEVVDIYLDKAVEDANFREIYARLCHEQIKEEAIRRNYNIAKLIFCQALVNPVKKNIEDYSGKERQIEIDAETCVKKKNDMQKALLKVQARFRRRKFSTIMFVGHLYNIGSFPVRAVASAVDNLLKTVTDMPRDPGYKADDAAVECAVRLILLTGEELERGNTQSRMMAEAVPEEVPLHYNIDYTLRRLRCGMRAVSSRVRFLIMNLLEYQWKPRMITVDGVSKSIEGIKQDLAVERMSSAFNKILKEERLHKEQQNVIEDTAVKPSEQTKAIEQEMVQAEDLTGGGKYWKEKYDQLAVEKEDTERKYRKLLMMVGRGKLSDDMSG